MSYCQIITFEKGLPKDHVEYSNSWGGCAFVWGSLFDAYLKDPLKPYDNWLSGIESDDRLWKLTENNQLPLFERAVLTFTFDWAIVYQKNFKQLASHLREFVYKYLPEKGTVCHLPAWADFIEISNAEVIGLHATSVSENLWYPWDEEKDENIPYNLHTMDKHLEVYEYLDEIRKAHETKVERLESAIESAIERLEAEVAELKAEKENKK
jgi:hypothetical protein